MLLRIIFGVLVLLAGAVACAALLNPHADASTVSVYSLPQVMQTTSATALSSSGLTALSVKFNLTPPVGDAIVCTEGDGYNGPVTQPTGYTQLATSTTPSNDVGVTVYYHVVAAGDGNPTLTFHVTTTTTWFVSCDDWHGTNVSVPIQNSAVTAFGVGVNSLTFPALTPNEAGTVPVEVAVHNLSTIITTDTNLTNSDWTVTQTGLSAQELSMPMAWTPFNSAWTGNPAFAATADTAGIAYVMRPLIGNFNLGGRVVAAATPTPGAQATTPPPSTGIAAYHPSYIYFGSAGGGGGGDDCTSACANGTILSAVNVRYAETGNASNGQCCSGSNWDPANSAICGANNVNCRSIAYQSFTQNQCMFTSALNEYNDLSGLYVSTNPTPDPGFTHTSLPGTPNNRASAPIGGSCPYKGTVSPSPTPGSVVQNPGGTGVKNVLMADWYTNATFIASRTYYGTRYDNSGDIAGATAEYGNGSQTAQFKYLHPLWSLYASLSPYPIGMNAGGSGGGTYSNGVYDTSHIVFGCTNHICGDPDGICNANVNNNFWFVQWERPLTSGTYSGETNVANNLPYMLDSAAEYYNNAGCKNVDMVDLEQVTTSGTDNPHLRQLELAVRMLMEPGDYDGTKGHRAWVMQRYNDCSACINHVAVFPEDGLNFVPASGTSMAKWTETTGSDGNGCTAGDSGGAKTYVVACTGSDINGHVGAVYGRAGECYKFGLDYGPCFVLINQSSSTVTVQDTWCSNHGGLSCSSYGHVWSPTGTGEEQYVQDNSSLGTINPNTTGAWGEATEPGTLTIGACPGIPTVLANDCSVVLLSDSLANQETYQGVQVFDANNIYTTSVASASVDTNSSAVLANQGGNALDSTSGFISGIPIETFNLATNSTATWTPVVGGSHNPPVEVSGMPLGTSAAPVPWATSGFAYESCCSDHHGMVINTDTKYDYEMYGITPPGSSLTVGAGIRWNLAASLSSQYQTDRGNANASDEPYIAGGLISDRDCCGVTINHALAFIYPTNSLGAHTSSWGYIRPASGPVFGSAGNCGVSVNTDCTASSLYYGDHLRLKSTVTMTCIGNGTCPQTASIVAALKKYGMFYEDQASSFGLVFFANHNTISASNWSSTDLANLNSIHITDFDIISRGTVICESGHSPC